MPFNVRLAYLRYRLTRADMVWAELASFVAALGWAFLLLTQGNVFSLSVVFKGMSEITSGQQWPWGTAFLAAAVLKAFTLVNQGRRMVRISSFVSLILWYSLTASITLSGGLNPGIFVYGWMGVASSVLFVRTMRPIKLPAEGYVE